MIIAILDLRASAEKRTEVFQTLASAALMIRGEKGCLRCQFCQESEDDMALTLIEEWGSREALDAHLRSQVFGILLGLMPLLKGPPGMRICTGASRDGMEAVRRARGQAAASAPNTRTLEANSAGVLRRIARTMRGRIPRLLKGGLNLPYAKRRVLGFLNH